MSTVYRFPHQTFHPRYRGEQSPTGTVELTVDWNLLVRVLGGKAADNHGGKTRALAGALRAKFIPDKGTP